MKAKLYKPSGEAAGEVDLPQTLFSIPAANLDLLHQVLRAELANRRKVLSHVKNRGEVRGGGKKPWAQKGTGRARHGSIRSPLWKGGGVTHGPTKERAFSLRINKKMRAKAILTALSDKAKRGDIKVVENVALQEGKTEEAVRLFAPFLKEGKKFHRALFLLPARDEKILRATKNLPYLTVMPAAELNLLSLLEHRFLILTPESISILEQRFHFSTS